MTTNNSILNIRTELETSIKLPKCLKCGCMQETLANLLAVLPKLEIEEALTLHNHLSTWSTQILPIKYACLGCDHCYPAIAQNLFATAFPTIKQPTLACDFQINNENWPPVVGEYFVIAPTAPVAVSTLASVKLAQKLANTKPNGLAIVGKTETENIGIDKIIKNVITNAALRYLIVCGTDSKGHQTGKTLLALAKNGVDAKGRVIESSGKRPILQNVTKAEINQFRNQITIINLLNCEDINKICSQIETLASPPHASCSCNSCNEESTPKISAVQPILASESDEKIALDKAGYFVILPIPSKKIINVEYYTYNNKLQHIIEGKTAKAIYMTLINNGWVTALSHAAYLGKELAKAELSLKFNLNYNQDGA